jgi:hypothetical protein
VKSFLIKAVVFISLIALSIVALYFENPIVKNTNDYLSAIIDKHKKLETTNPPRIILVGGSNLAFGVDSKEIQDSIGIPVINMGLHAGLGYPFMLGEIKNEIKKYDIIILSMEYNLSGEYYDLISYVRNIYPKSTSFISSTLVNRALYEYNIRINSLKDYIAQIQNNRFFWIGNKGKSKIEVVTDTNNIYDIYKRSSFSDYGDILPSITKKSGKELSGREKIAKSNYTSFIKTLNRFGEDVKSKGATIYFLFPNYPNSEFKKNKDAIDFYENQLVKRLNIKMINKPISFVFPDSCFFDTVYHLNNVGRKKRTDLLVQIIKTEITGKDQTADSELSKR